MKGKTALLALGAPAAVAAAGLIYAHWLERAFVQLDHYTVRIDKRGLPPEGLTILHLSDFHFRATDRVQAARLTRLLRALDGRPYDILALTGDLIHDEDGLGTALAFLDRLHPRLAAYSVPGNRDYWESSFSALLGAAEERKTLSLYGRLRLVVRNLHSLGRTYFNNERAQLRVHENDITQMHRTLADRNIEPLMNRAVRINRHGIDIWLAGIDDLTQGRPDLPTALREVPPGSLLVLLAHNPDTWLDPLVGRADLVLSGHTHGGQLSFPVVGALYRQGTHFDRRKAAGWFERDSTVMFVTRGLGESFPFRFGARPQAALIRLIPGRDGRERNA